MDAAQAAFTVDNRELSSTGKLMKLNSSQFQKPQFMQFNNP